LPLVQLRHKKSLFETDLLFFLKNLDDYFFLEGTVAVVMGFTTTASFFLRSLVLPYEPFQRLPFLVFLSPLPMDADI
jgi:hypothetical protein